MSTQTNQMCEWTHTDICRLCTFHAQACITYTKSTYVEWLYVHLETIFCDFFPLGGLLVCVYGRCTLWVSIHTFLLLFIFMELMTATYNCHSPMQFLHLLIHTIHITCSDSTNKLLCFPPPPPQGELPYQDIPMPSLVARVVSGYRLPKPEHASEQV